jgi:hypothetical protein
VTLWPIAIWRLPLESVGSAFPCASVTVIDVPVGKRLAEEAHGIATAAVTAVARTVVASRSSRRRPERLWFAARIRVKRSYGGLEAGL